LVAWIKLSKDQKQAIITNVANQKGLNEQVIEKDIWVTLVLEALFSLPGISNHLVFKGGTSLSKGYNLIDRFSEDIDFAIDRKFLGFGDAALSNTQIKKLRKASFTFTKQTLAPKLSARLLEMDVPAEEFKVRFSANEEPDADPLPIHIEYKPVSGISAYLADKVILEIGARSLMEPAEAKQIKSLLADVYLGQDFAGKSFEVTTVLPSRTFLEKIFLIHEQFLLNEQKPPRNRMSRHLYDIEKLMDTIYAVNAFKDKVLFEHIVAHRQMFTPVRGITYDKHTPSEINILPPEEVITFWEKDYSEFIEHMVVGKTLGFDELIKRLVQLQERLREVSW
jgi:nucleotidyltransferase AbiEii toxin of type IV toxin-antitoxin system